MAEGFCEINGNGHKTSDCGGDGMPKVTLYTVDDCNYCDDAKKFLKSEGVSFKEVDLDGKPELMEKFVDSRMRLITPIVCIKDSRGEKCIKGFDEEAIEKRLNGGR